MMKPLDRALRVLICSLIATLVALASAAAEAPFRFEDTPGRLPKTVVPIHYSIELTPDFGNLTFSGAQTVDIEVRAPTDALVLHAVDLTIASASIEGVGPAQRIVLDPKAETVTLTFARPLGAGRYRLAMAFAGRISSFRENRAQFGRGLSAVDYGGARQPKRMIVSNLEPAEARRIFPAWDEPSFKAAFELHVTVADEFLAVSNMPVAREEAVGGGRKRVSFAPTPRMSTYLFVLAVGELAREAVEAEGVSIGVVTPATMKGYAQYALTSAADVLKFYNDYFGVKYPLPKLDLIAVPGGIGFGLAMENWGGITFHEMALLYDPDTTPEEQRQLIFMTIAHEMAHQWFGDLVTLAWWDNLWLNEGFATWMQYKATDRLNPDWHIWLYASDRKQVAMQKDARRGTHPVQQPVANDKDMVITAFDEIVYDKGQAVVRMLEAYLGEDVFREGMRAYMGKHAHSNATSADLWQALEAASGKPIAGIANPFIEQAGIPFVLADADCVDGGQRMRLQQERFAIEFPNAAPYRWQVPIRYGPVRAGAKAEQGLLDGTSEIVAGRCEDAAKLNLGDTGYYRVKYDPATQAALEKSIPDMSPVDRANFIDDVRALKEAGLVSVAADLDLIERLGPQTDAAVVTQVIRTLERIDHLARGRPGHEEFRAYARATLRPVFVGLGVNAAAGEALDRPLVARVVRALGAFGDETIIAQAKRSFAAFLSDPTSLPKDLRGPVVYLVGRYADRATYDTLLGLARASTRGEERVRYYSAAAAALDPALAKETLAVALGDELTPSLAGEVIEWVAEEHRALTWDFLRANFALLSSQQDPVVRDVLVPGVASMFTDRMRAEEVTSFAPIHATEVGRIAAARARETILADAALAERQVPALSAWLRARPARP